MQVIEKAGRTCYKSEDKMTPGSSARLVRQLLQSKHESVIEHASASFRFITDRGVTHELVRHRLASFSQESTRYCNYGKDKFGSEITVVRPVGVVGLALDIWHQGCLATEKAYFLMLESGATPQIARSVLPNSLKTEIVVTANLREWRHIFTLRTAKAAHPQMRELAQQALDIMRGELPVLFEDI